MDQLAVRLIGLETSQKSILPEIKSNIPEKEDRWEIGRKRGSE
jgi:hypothetical protein